VRPGFALGFNEDRRSASGPACPIPCPLPAHHLNELDMLEPRELVEKLERPAGPPHREEGFAGYGVMGLTFTSGYILGLRRFPASALGPSYTSLWLRDPQGVWSVYQDVPPDRACTQHFGRVVGEAALRDINIAWRGPDELVVQMGGPGPITWSVTLVEGPATRVMNALGGMTPGPLWRQPLFLKLMGGVAGLALGAGHLALDGQATSGRRFVANPRLIWTVGDSTATVAGRDVGRIGPLPAPARPPDFWVPQRGLFVMGSAFFETLDPARQRAAAI
jgi:hypothetical protein